MAETQKNLVGGLTPGKLGAIILLSIVLLVVIIVQFSGNDSTPIVAKKKRAATGSTDVISAKPDSEEEQDEHQAQRWPEIPRAEVLLHDPFGLPTFLDPNAQSQVEGGAAGGAGSEAGQVSDQQRRTELLASLRSSGVDMVLMGSHGKVAHIGDLKVREGDLLEGLRVVEIHSRGIVLKRELPPEETGQQTGQQIEEQIENQIEQQTEIKDKKLGLTVSSMGFSWLKSRMKQALGIAGSPAGVEDEVEAEAEQESE